MADFPKGPLGGGSAPKLLAIGLPLAACTGPLLDSVIPRDNYNPLLALLGEGEERFASAALLRGGQRGGPQQGGTGKTLKESTCTVN